MGDPAFGRRSLRLLCGLALAALAAGCMAHDPPDITGSLAPGAGAISGRDLAQATASWGERLAAHPEDADAARNYAAGLDAVGQPARALMVLAAAARRHPHDPDVLAAYGLELAKAGQDQRAMAVLAEALQPEHPDWRVLNAEGTLLDRAGKHAEAERVYLAALKVKPDDPEILSNLGLSYALAKKLPQAEATLGHAAKLPGATVKVRQNFALVLALGHRYAEAEAVARQDLPPAEAAANVRLWRANFGDGKPVAPAPTTGTGGRATASGARPKAARQPQKAAPPDFGLRLRS
ncbi:MAG TPA: tetratricopeptide repeat protein [Hyphomicrobiales bacterium]|nr:tetratricopeptide repeat protein [Hyphomicrobiales bacterium]